MIMSHGYNAAAIPAGYPVAGGYGHHPHQQLQQYHPAHLHYSAAAAQDAGPQPKVEPGAAPASPSAGASDPFSPSGCGFGAEDEFDVPPLPPTAMEDPPQPPPPTQAQHYYGAQQSMYPMNSYYGAQQQQQGGYSQYDQYAYAGGYGVYGGHHQQQQQHQGGVVLPGGPSPGGGSHNTPSPQAHSEDGDHDHVRNNNIIKTEAAVGAEGMRHGGMIGYAQHAAHHLIARKPKVSKRKKKRDPNEPQKPVSAYALFFRDTQAGIKQRNPNAAFGDVSKVVASMWDNLDPDSKAAYKKRTEMAKKEYLKKLAAYRASLISKGGLDGLNPYAPYASSYAEIAAMKGGYLTSAAGGGYLHGGQPIPPRPPMQQQPQHMGAPSALPSVERNHPGYMMQQHHNYNSQMSNGIQARPNSPSSQHSQHSPTATGDCRTSNGHLAVAASNGGSANAPITTMADSGATTTTTSSVSGAAAPNGGGCGVGGESRRCGRPSCGSVSASGAAEFCSSECVVGQCREVYTNWSGASNGQQQQQQQSAPRSEYSPRVAK